MYFSSFVDLVPKIKNLDLPGTAAQYKMAPQSRREELETIDYGNLSAKEAAVLCMIYPKENHTYFALILRNTYPGVHSNQISFPGGRREKQDTSFLTTALRETKEEIGVSENLIYPVIPLTKLFIPPSNFVVYPYLGYTENQPDFQPDPNEVSAIIEVELSFLLSNQAISSRRITTSYADNVRVNCFLYDKNIIWGATAMILNELRAILLTLK